MSLEEVFSILDPNEAFGYDYLFKNKTDSFIDYALEIANRIDFNNKIGIKSWSILQDYMSLEEVFNFLRTHVSYPLVSELEEKSSADIETIIKNEDTEALLNFIDINKQ